MCNTTTVKNAPVLTLLAAIILTTVLGSIHAFSVFLQILEETLNENRAQVSLIYSGALICLTISVLLGYRIYPRWSPPALVLVAGFVAALGVIVAGFSENYWLTLLGYSVIFGAANGIGYGFSLQIAAQAMPARRGFAMGTVTASYALGSTAAPFLFSFMLEQSGLAAALSTAGGIYIIAAIIAAGLLYHSKIKFTSENVENQSVIKHDSGLQRLLWLGYGSGALAGLMVIGHATGIVQAAGGSAAFAIGGAIVISLGNMAGGLLVGVLADRIRIGSLLMLLPLLSAIVLTLMAFGGDPTSVLAGLVLVGFCYGAIIAVYPVAVISLVGVEASSRVYGRVFTAWGLAGLLGPWLAGVFYDATGSYELAMLVAAVTGTLSVLVAYILSRQMLVNKERVD